MSHLKRINFLAKNSSLILYILSSFLLLSQTSQQTPSESNNDGPSPPKIITHPKNVTAFERSTAILICEAESNPKPTFHWLKDDQEINRRRTPIFKTSKGSVVRIEQLKHGRDNGTYFCKVENGIGTSVISQVELTIINESEAPPGFPQILVQPQNKLLVEIGGIAALSCQAKGDPEPEYSWFHETIPIDFNDPRFVSENGMLKISNVTEKDKGEYICMVQNSKGTITYKSTIAVSLEPMPDGAPLDLKHRLTSPTDVTITWSPPDMKSNVTLIGYEVSFGRLGSSSPMKYQANQSRIAFSDLSENTDYGCRIRARSRGGYGAYSEVISFTTPKDPPPAPTNVKASADSYSSAMIWWEDIPHIEGISGYRVYYNQSSMQRASQFHEDLDLWLIKNVSLTNSVIIGNLVENVQYEARVCAVGDYFSSKLSPSVKFRTAPEEVPYDLKASDLTTHSVRISWKPPLEMFVSEYKVVFNAPEKHYIDEKGEKKVMNIPPTTMLTNKTHINIGELVPYTRYRINVTAVPSNEAFKPPATIHITTAIAAPKQMNEPTLMGPVNGRQFDLFLPWASEEYGPIGYYCVVVLPEMPQIDPDGFGMSDLIVNSKSPGPISVPYIAAKFSKSRMPKRFTLGDNKTYEGFLNRELAKDQEYYVFVRAIVEHSENLYSSSRLSGSISLSPPKIEVQSNEWRSESNKKVRWFLLASLAMVLVLGFIVTIFYKKQRQALKTNQTNETTISLLPHLDLIYSTIPAEPVDRRNNTYQSRAMLNHPSIHVNELPEHIEFLRTNNNLKEEYESIEPGQQFTWEHSRMNYNVTKNRYSNVIAYDHSRVVLSPIDNIPGSDYINANYCDGYEKPNHYIATQGPLPHTVGDFWRMVWEQNSHTIVMMTQVEERGRIKCVQYWPSKESITYYGITITASKVEELAYYVIRKFILHCNNQKRVVLQFQFTAWPDHGVPNHPAPFLMFLRRIKISNPANAGPMVVLCSAGVGRTGCFIVIDSMIEKIKHDSKVDIYGHVTSLRAQRNYIVQTEDQYMFVHDSILEAVISFDTEIHYSKLAEHIQKLKQIMPEGASGLELEFKRLANIKFHTSQKNLFTSATLPVNRHKNRLMNILPYETTRVCLEPIAGLEGSDYINASFCDSYMQRNAYIATQSPIPDTVEDLWRMLIEHNSGIVVMLTKLKEMGREKCTQFWPAEKSGNYGSYCITFNQEFNSTSDYVLREFTVTDSRNPNYSGVIRLFHYINWPEQGVPSSGDEFINFIAEVHNTKQKFGIEGPITVLCSVGVGRTGVFIALSIILERLKDEGFLNIFETVRTLRTQRPGMVQTEDQYQFCYETALEYHRNFVNPNQPIRNVGRG